jgi:hypothetical protein
MLKSGPRSAWPRCLCMEQSMVTFSLPTDVCWKQVPQFVVMSKLPVWALTRTPAFKAARRSLAGAVRQTLFQGGNGPELPDLTDGGPGCQESQIADGAFLTGRSQLLYIRAMGLLNRVSREITVGRSIRNVGRRWQNLLPLTISWCRWRPSSLPRSLAPSQC